MPVELNTLGAVIKTTYEGESNTNAFTDAEKSKLSGIEDNADVTDTTNVAAAGALMESEVANIDAVKEYEPTNFESRAELVTWSASNTPTDGYSYWADGLEYVGSTGATAISDLPGLLPQGNGTPEHFGAVKDGSTDDSAAIQAAINYAEDQNGGDVVFAQGIYAIGSQLEVNKSHVSLVGVGGSVQQGGAIIATIDSTAGTTLRALPTISATGAVVLFTPLDGELRPNGGGARDIHIDAAANCQAALRIVTWARGSFERLLLSRATAANLDLDVVTTATLASNATYDTQYNNFIDVSCNPFGPGGANSYALRTNAYEDASNQWTSGGTDPDAIGNPNVSFNRFVKCDFKSDEQQSVYLLGATDNLFIQCDATPSDLDTHYGWMLTSSDQDERLSSTAAKQNTWIKCGGQFRVRGSSTSTLVPKANDIKAHRTSVLMQFRPVVEFENDDSGAEITVENSRGFVGAVKLQGTYENVRTRRQVGGMFADEHVVDASGGVTQITVAGALPAGAIIKGVTAYASTPLIGVGGYRIGISGDTDYFGEVTGFAAGTRLDMTDATGDLPLQIKGKTASDLIVERNAGGAFDGGTIKLCVWYELALTEWS